MEKNNKNFRTAFLVFTFFTGMFALAFASVPLYNLFCKVTGYGGTPKEVTLPAIDIRKDTIKVRFNTDVSRKKKVLLSTSK
jgi:cytochrome c oxidase assembly protein subunit 11